MSKYDEMSKIFVWANSDLDGACSVILLGNLFPKMDYRAAFFGDFLAQYTAWEKQNLDNYDKVFIVGMVIDQTIVNKIDDPKVVFVSDRGEKVKVYDSTMIGDEATSCSRLLYKKLKDKFRFPDDLKRLILYVDDYNSYNLKYKESEYLNAVYRTIPQKRFQTFVKTFWDGFSGFTDSEIARAEEFFDSINREYENLELMKSHIMGWDIICTTSNKSVNEIAKKIMDNHKTDVVIVVNLDTRFVSFRKPVGSTADIVYLAEKICNGGGGEWASGGSITEKFLDFTQTLKEL